MVVLVKTMFVVKRQIIRGHQSLTIPYELAKKLRGKFMRVEFDGNNLVYEPIDEGTEAI